MPAEPLLDERHVLSETAFAELVVWRVPTPVRGSEHRYRYRLALVVKGECVLRYDNEAGKGDRRQGRTAVRIYHAGAATGRFLGRRGELEALT